MEVSNGMNSEESRVVPDCGVFGQEGCVLSKDPHFLVLEYCGNKVSLSKEHLFIEGAECSDEEWEALSIGDSIYFDAFPLERRGKKKKIRATCGWMGHPPDLIHRFPFCLDVDKIPSSFHVLDGKNFVLAQVVFFPAPDIAVCKIKCGVFCVLSMLNKHMLRRVDGTCHDVLILADVLFIGDWVELHLKSLNSPGSESWFSIKPKKNSSESCKCDIGSCEDNSPSSVKGITVHQEETMSEALVPSLYSEELHKAVFSVNGDIGIFSRVNTLDVGVLLHKNVEVMFHKRDCFFEKVGWDDLLEPKVPNLPLKFEAVWFEDFNASIAGHYVATCVWDVRKPHLEERFERFNAWYNASMSKNFFKGAKERIVQGTVVSYALPGIAFLNVNEKDSSFCVMVHGSRLKTPSKNVMINFALKMGGVYEIKVRHSKRYAVVLSHIMPKASISSYPGSDNTTDFSNYIVVNRGIFYADGVGVLSTKLSHHDAIFLAKPMKSSKKWEMSRYAVYIKRKNVFSGGVNCQNWDEISGKELRVFSHSKKGLHGSSQEGICAVSLDCEVLNVCKIVSSSNFHIDVSLNYSGRVKQYLSYDTVLVKSKVMDQMVLLKRDVLCGISEKKKNLLCIRHHLSVGDLVTMKLERVEKDLYSFYQATVAQKGLLDNLNTPELIGESLNSCDSTISSISPLGHEQASGIEYEVKNANDSICSQVTNTLSSCTIGESNLSMCFSRLLNMSGEVVALLNDFEGKIVVDVLKLDVVFHLRDFVFWDRQDSERDQTLRALTPIGTFLMFNARKEYGSKSKCNSFRATKVWKPVCVPDSSQKISSQPI